LNEGLKCEWMKSVLGLAMVFGGIGGIPRLSNFSVTLGDLRRR
jgi:hypothetical protein